MDGVVDGVEVQLLRLLCQVELTLRCAELAVDTPGKVLLRVGVHVALEIRAEHLGKLCCMLCLFVCRLLPIQTDLGVALAVGNTSHAQVHADLRALAVEVRHQLIEDVFLVFRGNVGVVLDGRAVDAELMLGSELQFALDLFEHVALGMTYRALCRSCFAFVDVTANLANKLLHNKILRFFIFSDRNCFCFIYSAALAACIHSGHRP